MKKSSLFKTSLAIALAWMPTLFWLIFAVTGIILGTGGLFSSDFAGSVVFIALGAGGILGFIGLTSVCWTQRPPTLARAILLVCGVVSLSVAAVFLVVTGDWALQDIGTLLNLAYFVACPLAFSVYQIGRHAQALRRAR